MAGLVPGIHVFLDGSQNVDGRDKPGHDALKMADDQDAPSERAMMLRWISDVPSPMM